MHQSGPMRAASPTAAIALVAASLLALVVLTLISPRVPVEGTAAPSSVTSSFVGPALRSF